MQITFWTEKRNDGVSDITVEEDFRSDSVFTRTSGKSRRNRVFQCGRLSGVEVGMILDQDYHVAVRTGYQCAPPIHKYLGSVSYLGVVRASVGRFTTKEEN